MDSADALPQPTGYLRHALVLGLITAIGPFAIDMYLPSLPSIGTSLHARSDTVQLSLMGFFISLGLGQLFFGPLSDMVGRKGPVYFGLVVFAIGSIGCGLSTDIHMLIAFRVIQGLGASVGMTVPQAVIRDLHTGPEATRLMSLLMLVFSTSPILAPLFGSMLIVVADWRAVFWTVTIASILAMIVTVLFLEETRPPQNRPHHSIRNALAGYGALLRNRHFLGLAFCGAFGVSSFFVYLANSSFVFIGHFGLTPMLYSFAFSINAVAFIGTAQLNGWLTRTFGLRKVLWTACLGFAGAMLVLLALMVAGFQQIWVLIPLLFLGYGCLGLVLPTTAVLALDDQAALAGTASSLMGMLQFITGSAVIAVASFITNGTPRPMVIGIALCALATLGFAYFAVKRYEPAG